MRYFSISFIIIFPLIFGQCPKTESNKIKEKYKATESKESFAFEEIEHKIHNITENDTCIEFEILVDKYKIIMSLNKYNGSSKLILDNRIVNTDFNFVYDTDLESMKKLLLVVTIMTLSCSYRLLPKSLLPFKL